MLFDNGLFSRNVDISLQTGSSRNYSAARKYVIDETARTATEVWTYNHGIYSPVCSSAYEKHGSTLIVFSSEGGQGPILSDSDVRMTRFVGVGGRNRVAFDYAFRKYDRFCGDAWSADIAELSDLMFLAVQ